MKTIETTATVTRRRKLRLQLQLPDDFPTGNHRVVVIIESQPLPPDTRPPLALPVDNYGPWPQTFSLSREALYDDFGR